MSKIVVFVDGGNISYIGSNLEGLEVVVIDKDNLKEGMGYTDVEIDQIYDRETKGLKSVDFTTPPEAEEVMVVQAYKAPEPWSPKEGEWCWYEIPGLCEFKLAQYSGPKEGQNVYKFDGVLPMAEVLNQEVRIEPSEVIHELVALGNPDVLAGDFWHIIQKPAPDAPNGYDVNVWNDGHTLKMTAYALLEGDDGKIRTSMLHPLMSHEFTLDEKMKLLESTQGSIAKIAQNASGGKSLLDALGELDKTDPKNEPKQ